MMTQGITGAVTSVTTLTLGIVNIVNGEAMLSVPATQAAGHTLITQGVMETVGGVSQGVASGVNIVNADSMSTGGSSNVAVSTLPEQTRTDLETLCSRNPDICNGRGSNPQTVNVPALKEEVDNKISEANQTIEKLKDRGFDVKDMSANPKKYGVNPKNIKTSSLDLTSQEDLRLPANDSYEGSVLSDSSEYSIGDFSRADFSKLTDLFDSLTQEKLDNSAPGYYGNVPLSALNPGSKMSLFERVSQKIKNVTSQKNEHDKTMAF